SFFFSSRRRHTRSKRDWSSDVCSSDLLTGWFIPMGILAKRVLALQMLILKRLNRVLRKIVVRYPMTPQPLINLHLPTTNHQPRPTPINRPMRIRQRPYRYGSGLLVA